jgi:uncharacterized membrane protein (UPF0127 family)
VLPVVCDLLSVNCGADSLIENRRRIRQVVRMKIENYFALVLVALLSVSCGKSSPPAPAADISNDDTLTHAQPKLRTMKIYLGAEILDAELALSDQEIHTGMMFRTNILETDAMLFNLRNPQRANFWMKNCPESISAAYITSDGVIQEIHHLEKNDTNGVVAACEDIQFVLETQDGWFGHHHVATGTVIRTEKGSLAETFLQRR